MASRVVPLWVLKSLKIRQKIPGNRNQMWLLKDRIARCRFPASGSPNLLIVAGSLPFSSLFAKGSCQRALLVLNNHWSSISHGRTFRTILGWFWLNLACLLFLSRISVGSFSPQPGHAYAVVIPLTQGCQTHFSSGAAWSKIYSHAGRFLKKQIFFSKKKTLSKKFCHSKK